MIERIDERLSLSAILISALVALYFLLLDHVALSTAHFARIFRLLLTAYDAKTVWLTLAACVAAAAWRDSRPFLRLVDLLACHPVAVAILGAGLLALAVVAIYHDYPFSMDEYAAVFQAETFATGRIEARLPASLVDWLVMPGFNGNFIYASRETGRAIEGYWPGFALLLAPFEVLGVPWACNPLLAGIALYLMYRITFELTSDRRAAAWAMLFALASGAFVANAISYYSMQAHLTANLLFAWLLLRPTSARAFGAGLVGSLALVLHNPFPHTMFALPWILAIAASPQQRRFLWPLIAGYLPGCACGVAWLLLRMQIIPVDHSVAAVSGVGGGVFVWPDQTLLNMRAAALAKLWVWAAPGLLVLAGWGSYRHFADRRVRLLTASAALTFAAYLFVKLDQGHGWGYRYFHSAWGALPILAACAMTAPCPSAGRLAAFAGAASLAGLLLIVPLQLGQIEATLRRQLAQIPAPVRPGRNVYFLHAGAGFYLQDMVHLDPLAQRPDLLLNSRGVPMDRELIRQNWPSAVEVGDTGAVQQWVLGVASRPEPSFTANP